MANHATLELANNYENTAQLIKGKQIPSIVLGTTIPPTVTPDFKGQFYYAESGGDACLYVADGLSASLWKPIDSGSGGDVYLGRKNNFTDSLQQILNKQITTIAFTDEETPKGAPDFAGQLYISRFGGKFTLFVAKDGSLNGWVKISGEGGAIDLSNIAQLDKSNNFDQIQSIKNNAIVSVINGAHVDPNGKVTPDYPGQLYIYEDEETKRCDYYISDASGGWDMLNEEMNTNNFVKNNTVNNFDRTEQTILTRQIVTVIVSDGTPNIQPNFIGQIYLDKTSTTGNVYLATSRDATPDSANWICLNMPGSMPDDVVLESVGNDFQVQNQKIRGNQIATTVFASTDPPAADAGHVGRIHVKNDGTTIKAWICVNTSDITYEYKPLTAEIGNEFARKDKTNNFVALDGTEKQGQLIHGRDIMTAIIRNDTPDISAIRPEFKGQLYIYRKIIGTGPEYDTALWIADDNGTLNLQWTPLQRDLSTLFARKDIENLFTWPVQCMQYRDDESTTEFIMGARRINGLPTTLKPSRVGEVIISEISFEPPTPSIFRVFVALSDRVGDWLKISDTTIEPMVNDHESRIDTLEGHKDTHSTKITTLEGHRETDSARISAVETFKGNAERQIRELETNVTSNVSDIASNLAFCNTTFGEHSTRITTAQTKADTNLSRIIFNENKLEEDIQKVNALEATVNGFNPRITKNTTDIASLQPKVNNNEEAININRTVITTNKTLQDAIGVKANANETAIANVTSTSITALELNPTDNKLVGKNAAGEVVCELALPSDDSLAIVESIDITTGSRIYLEQGHTHDLRLEVYPENATVKRILYSSSNPEIATVSSEGIITAVSVGDATITCTSYQGGVTSSCEVKSIPIVTIIQQNSTTPPGGTTAALLRRWGCGDKLDILPAHKLLEKYGGVKASSATNNLTTAYLYVVSCATDTFIDSIHGTWTIQGDKYVLDVNRRWDEDVYFILTSYNSGSTHNFKRCYNITQKDNLIVHAFANEQGINNDVIGTQVATTSFNKNEAVFTTMWREA